MTLGKYVYLTALVMDEKYIDVAFWAGNTPEDGRRAATQYVLPEFRDRIGSVILKTFSQDDEVTLWERYPEYISIGQHINDHGLDESADMIDAFVRSII